MRAILIVDLGMLPFRSGTCQSYELNWKRQLHDEQNPLTREIKGFVALTRIYQIEFKFYEEFFERRFLEDTEQFFKRSPVVHDQSQSMYEKMAASSSILASEEHLCKSILFLPTVEKSLESLRALFVLGPMDRYTSVLPEYVRNEMKSGN